MLNNKTLIILICWLTVSITPSLQAFARVNIMPLGDSITYGVYSAGTPAPTLATGYRQPLWLSLIENTYDVNFVGAEQNGENALPPFDTDHEGHPGIEAAGLGLIVQGLLNDNPTDVVLLHIGTNGLSSGTVLDIKEDINSILNHIDQASEDIIVLLAQIIDYRTPSDNVTDLNILIKAMADERRAAGDKIYIVDQYNALTYPGDMADPVHPNQAGYDKMADTWLATLDTILHLVTPKVVGSGRIEPSTAQTMISDIGTAFTITPDENYHIDTVTGCDGTLDGNTYTTGPVTADCMLIASFAIDAYTVTLSAGANGSISPSSPQTVDHGATTSLTIIPDDNYHIDTVTGCNGRLDGNIYTTGNITDSCEVTATFDNFPWSMFLPAIISAQ